MIAEEAAPVENLDPAAVRDVLSKAQSQLSSASSEKVCRIYNFSILVFKKNFCRKRQKLL